MMIEPTPVSKEDNGGVKAEQKALGQRGSPGPDGTHPLETGWAIWYDKKTPHNKHQQRQQHQHQQHHGTNSKLAQQEQYKASIKKVGRFDTIEGFWRNYVHLKRPSMLERNINIYLFRDGQGIAPMWEAFPSGGAWILKIKKRQLSGTSVLGKLWQDLVLALIGECFEEPNVVGVGMAIRTNEDLLSVWNADNSNDQVRFHVGEKLKKVLDLEPSTVIEYKHHKASIQDMSSFKNAKPYVFAATR